MAYTWDYSVIGAVTSYMEGDPLSREQEQELLALARDILRTLREDVRSDPRTPERKA